MNPDRIAELEEERRFLLRSLDDLDREYAAGDVDEVDYVELRDGYTARAAATMREIDEGRSSLPQRRPPDWSRRVLVGVAVVALIGVVWWILAATSAQRLPGQEITGRDPRTQVQQLLAQARAAQFQAPGTAADLYLLVLETDPDNVEALTYRGWTLALDAVSGTGSSGTGSSDATGDATGIDPDQVQTQLVEAIDLLEQATAIDPGYPDPECFLGIIYGVFLEQPDLAIPHVDACLAGNPPADVRDLVEPFRARLGLATGDDGASTG